ncbi:MAG: response regulator [Paracoccaceae bacterium]
MALVYVLDDDQDLGGTIKGMVDSLGHDCAVFCNGDSFVDAVRSNAPQIYLIDMWLGRTTALEVVAKFPELLRGIPAIMMSGGGGPASLETVSAIADMEGFAKVLYKPFQRAELKAALDEHLHNTRP